MAKKGKEKQRARKKAEQVKKNKRQQYHKTLVAKILKHEAPSLLQESVNVIDGEDLSFIADLKRILAVSKTGVGLAACQIGVNKRVFAYREEPSMESPIRVCINPEFVSKSEEMVKSSEGCLSYPGFAIIVDRHAEVELSFLDENMKQRKEAFSDWLVRIVQHEMEHFTGKCALYDEWKRRNA